MAKFDLRPIMEFQVKVVLTEEEARALQYICKYGADTLIKGLDTVMTTKEISKGIRSLVRDTQDSINKQISKIDEARKVVEE